MQCIFSSNGFLVVGGKTGSCLSPRSAFATSKALHLSRQTKTALKFGPRSQQQPLFLYSASFCPNALLISVLIHQRLGLTTLGSSPANIVTHMVWSQQDCKGHPRWVTEQQKPNLSKGISNCRLFVSCFLLSTH